MSAAKYDDGEWSWDRNHMYFLYSEDCALQLFT